MVRYTSLAQSQAREYRAAMSRGQLSCCCKAEEDKAVWRYLPALAEPPGAAERGATEHAGAAAGEAAAATDHADGADAEAEAAAAAVVEQGGAVEIVAAAEADVQGSGADADGGGVEVVDKHMQDRDAVPDSVPAAEPGAKASPESSAPAREQEPKKQASLAQLLSKYRTGGRR